MISPGIALGLYFRGMNCGEQVCQFEYNSDFCLFFRKFQKCFFLVFKRLVHCRAISLLALRHWSSSASASFKLELEVTSFLTWVEIDAVVVDSSKKVKIAARYSRVIRSEKLETPLSPRVLLLLSGVSLEFSAVF